MTRLMRELIKDPEAVFDFEFELPSGNRCVGTIGPLVNGFLTSGCRFERDPSEEDRALTVASMDALVGISHAVTWNGRDPKDRERAAKEVRGLMGGGMG